MDQIQNNVGIVTIGRNEGERLKRCLNSLSGKIAHMVYVDSGSTDGSGDFARSLNVDVVELDMTKPFSMARGRNAGAKRLLELQPELKYIHFVDGDCEVVPEWIPTAFAYLEAHPDVWVVCGRRRERFPENSIYNMMCDIEWNSPVGEAKSCGGDALMRAEAFQSVGGFEEALIAGEEPELCLRLRKAGGKIQRLDAEMTLHDANILQFKPWWKRNLRGGYGASDVIERLKSTTPREEIPFFSLVKSAPVWSIGWLAVTVLPGLMHPLLCLPGLGLWGLQSFRIAKSVESRAAGFKQAWIYGIFTLIGKWPQWLGILKYRRDLKSGKVITLIEYK
ncbi:glycosyltransferase [Kiritimatiellaeota bacterium B1221]|nr:glycosyltransferase [Kiritimatiellaeota bacterium B1221]